MTINQLKNSLVRALPLALGMALSIVLVAKICFDLSYDKFYADIDRIYQIRCGFSQQGSTADHDRISGGVAPGFMQYIAGVASATRYTGLFDSNKYLTDDKNTISADGGCIVADTCFFSVFDRDILIGNASAILNTWGQVMVSRSLAEKLGGVAEAVGRTICNYDMPQLQLTVGGVFDDFPENGTLHFDVLIPMCMYSERSANNWVGNDRYIGYVKLDEGIDPASLGEAIRLMQEKNQPLDEMEKQGTKIWYYLSPFDNLHTGNPDIRNAMILLAVIAVMLMAISVLNYLLSVVSAVVRRAKGFATRKCFGAGGRNIYGVLFAEASVTIAMALALAALMLAAAEPVIVSLAGISLGAMLVPLAWVAIGAMVVMVLVCTAAIPGYIYMRIPITAALRAYSDNKRRWKYVLLVSQFTINVFLFGMLSVVVAQYNKVLSDDMGYDYSGVFYFSTSGNDPQKIAACADALRSIPGVADVQQSYGLPMFASSGNNVMLPDDPDRELFNVADQYEATEGFFRFFDIPIVEGREPRSPNDVAVSRSFVRKMAEFAHWPDGAVGKQILVTEHSQTADAALTICGVFEDYLVGTVNNRDPRPMVRFCAEAGSPYLNMLLVKAVSPTPELVRAMEQTIAEVLGNGLEIEAHSYSAELRNLYSGNKTMRDTFMVGCLFALLISVFGLIGYIGNESARRSKEIAIRKINGATASDIAGMFVADGLRMAGIAIVVGDVLVYVAASGYLRQFAERIGLGVWHFAVADLLLVAIIVATVVANSIRISMANPVKSIKNE